MKYFLNGPRSPIKKDMSGKTILITGASAGIGKETALELLEQGAKVILASRSESKSLTIIKKSKNSQNGYFYPLDLSSYNSILQFVEILNTNFPDGIDILINNAGQAFSIPELTSDLIEKSIETNFIGPFILTALLIKKIKPNGKIINVASEAHKLFGLELIENLEKDLDFLNLQSYYSSFKMYGFTKLANIVHAKFLAEMYPSLCSTSLHPGVVSTEIWDKVKGCQKICVNVLKPFAYFFVKNERMGAQTTVYLAYEDVSKISNGGYYADCREKKTKGLMGTPGIEKRVMGYTKVLIEKYLKDLPDDLKEHIEMIDKSEFKLTIKK